MVSFHRKSPTMFAISPIFFIVLLSAYDSWSAYTSKFHDRDLTKKHDISKTQHALHSKRTVITPYVPDTPDMTVLTPNTPDTPDTKMKIPQIKDTPDSSGLFMSGDDEDIGSGSNTGSGYAEVESGSHKPILWLAAPNAVQNLTQGSFKVFWRPNNTQKAKIKVKGVDFVTDTNAFREEMSKENDKIIATKFRTNNENAYLKDLKSTANIMNDTRGFHTLLENTDLESFLSHFGRSIIPKTGDARKGKSHHQNQMVKAKPDTLGQTYKKQGLEVPFDDKEGLGGEPVGNLNAEGGIEGLGGEMQGFPTGMGAGAEPLGAYDRDPQQNYQEGGIRPRLDEGQDGGYGGLPMGFSREPLQNGFSQQENMNPGGDFFEGRSPPYGDEPASFKSPGPFGQLSDAENVMGPRQMQMQNFLNPQPAMDESMSNNIDAMDKANVQGDSDVGEMVRARANSPRQTDQPVPGENDSQFIDQRSRNPYEQESEGGEPEYRNFKKSSASEIGTESNDNTPIPDYDSMRRNARGFSDNKRKSKYIQQGDKDEVNFWKKNGDVHFDDMRDLEQRIDGENYNMIKRYNDEDLRRYRASKFFEEKYQASRRQPFWNPENGRAQQQQFVNGRTGNPFYGSDIYDLNSSQKGRNGFSSMTNARGNTMNFIGESPTNHYWRSSLNREKDTVDNGVPRGQGNNRIYDGGYEMTAYNANMLNMAQVAMEKRKRKRTNIIHANTHVRKNFLRHKKSKLVKPHHHRRRHRRKKTTVV